jgi:UDP-glucose:(heptosyl)LPS alpha-1,3-glucosyltransferase
MDVALCYPHVVPARGGCETYIVDVARRLAADGHDVHLYAAKWDAQALPARVQVHPVHLPECLRFRRPWLFGAACLRSLRTRRHDVSLGFDKTWGQDVLYPQGGLHLATVEHNHHIPSGNVGRRLSRLRSWLDLGYWSFCRLERQQYLSASAPLVMVNSRMVAEHFRQYYGIAPEQLRLVPNAIDPGRFEARDRDAIRAAMRERCKLPPGTPAALFAAMNYPLKGLAPLLHAVKLLPESLPFVLLVVGSPRTRRYRWLARKLGVSERVRFLGHCADMRHAYFAADCLVHPTFYDPCSLVVLEALACGLPVITTRYNGASELLRGDEGFVIDEPHDHAKLAECLVQLTDNRVRTRCAEAARAAARRWTFDDHYARLGSVLHEAAQRRHTLRRAA